MENEQALDKDMQTALTDLLKLIGMQPPDGVITAAHIQEADAKIKALMEQQQKAAKVCGSPGSSENPPSNITSLATHCASGHDNVLITGQLGIIVHQLRQAITKLGGEVTIAKDMEEAISEYQRKDYSLVIIDLYMPTEREGLIVVEEIKRIATACQISTQVIVLAPQSKDKGIRDRCKSKGAAFFLEKMEGWHKTILQYYMGEIPADQFEIA